MRYAGAGNDKGRPDAVLPAVFRAVALVALTALVGGAAAYAVSQPLPREYKAVAQLYVAPLTTGGLQDVALGSRLAQSYVQLTTTDVVLRPAMREIGETDASAVRVRTEASQPRDNPIVAISFKDGDAERAATMANAIAASLVARTNELQQSRSQSAIRQLDDQIGALQSSIKDLTTRDTEIRQQLQREPARADVQFLLALTDQQLQGDQAMVAQLLASRDGMKLAQARDSGSMSVWQPATPPRDPDSPRVQLNTLLGALAGASIAFLVTVLRRSEEPMAVEEERGRLGVASLAEVQRS